MERRTAGTVVMLVGITLIVFTLSIGFFGATNAWERVSSDTRGYFTEESVATARADVNNLAAAGQEFATKGTVALAGALGTTPAQAAAAFAGQFPNTAAALTSLEPLTASLTGQINVIDQNRARYARVDATPNGSLSSTTIPWFMVIVGGLAVLVGLGMIAGYSVTPAIAIVLGIVMLAVPLVYQLPSKSSAADTLNDNLRPIYGAQSVAAGRQAVITLRGMSSELSNKLVPTLAAQLKVTPAQAQQFIATTFPTFAASIATLPAAVTRLDTFNTILNFDLGEFETVQSVNYTPIPWIVIAGGVLTTFVSIWALAMTEVGVQVRESRRTRRAQKRAA